MVVSNTAAKSSARPRRREHIETFIRVTAAGARSVEQRRGQAVATRDGDEDRQAGLVRRAGWDGRVDVDEERRRPVPARDREKRRRLRDDAVRVQRSGWRGGEVA